MTSDAAAQRWPGERLGLPESGPRSIGRTGRRLAALTVDWGLAYAIGYFFFRGPNGTVDGFVITAVFVVMQILFISLVAGSIGHLVLGLRVVAMTGGWVGVLRPAVRSILLAVVIPAVIWDRDQRGLHDRLAGTVLVRR